ncbi:MAG: SBBP repeat-containing protein, partial [Cyanobacteria bacterium P01_A01_bin.40]
MDDFDLFVALLTPASDLVGGDPGSETQGIFARAGNDTIYGYDPGINNNENPKVDVLVGDLFDNSPEEFQIIVDIQEGNPLAILDRGKPPSVGADRFVLGDEIQPYYTTFDPISLVGDNLLGINQFAVLYDFDPEQDIIQLNGKKNDYELLEVNGLVVEGIDQPFFGEAIFSLQQGAPDLVGYVISTPEVDLDLDKNYFEFVGDKPEDKPDEKKIGQLGTTGIDQALGVATDGDGNVYIAGSTSGPLGGANQGSSDAWVARYNSNGNQTLLQQSNISTPSGDIANAVATDDNGNYYLAGSRGSNAWVAKYNNSGQEQWSNLVSLPGAFTTSGFGLDIDGEGNVYLSGLGIKENPDRATFDFAVEDDAWIAKFDTGGTRQWLTPIDTPFFNENYDLAVDEAGNSYAVGWTQGLVEESDPSRDLLKYDVWISKQDTNGNIEWIQQLGSADEGLEFAWGVDTDSQGNIYVTGWTTGALGTQDKEFEKSESYDVFLAKFAPELDQDGNSLLWAKQIGSQGDDGM